MDITSVFKLKKAVLCHKSQNPERFINCTETMNGYRSAQCNSQLNLLKVILLKIFHLPIQVSLPKSPKLRRFEIKN